MYIPTYGQTLLSPMMFTGFPKVDKLSLSCRDNSATLKNTEKMSNKVGYNRVVVWTILFYL